MPVDTVAIVGNCLAVTMAAGLSSVPLAATRFKFIAVPVHPNSLDLELVELVRGALSAASHIFVATRHIRWIRAIAPAESQLITYPEVVLRSPWPFDLHSGARDEVAAATPRSAIRHHDGALAKLREAEPDKEKRFQMYRDLEFEWAGAVDRVIEAQQWFLEDVDTATGACLGSFITRHFKEKQLFYDSTHPSEIVFQELCEFCWHKLELPGQPPLMQHLDGWKVWSLPVHPLIARRLDLTWASERTRYSYGLLGSVTWEQWARAYINIFG